MSILFFTNRKIHHPFGIFFIFLQSLRNSLSRHCSPLSLVIARRFIAAAISPLSVFPIFRPKGHRCHCDAHPLSSYKDKKTPRSFPGAFPSKTISFRRRACCPQITAGTQPHGSETVSFITMPKHQRERRHPLLS